MKSIITIMYEMWYCVLLYIYDNEHNYCLLLRLRNGFSHSSEQGSFKPRCKQE